MKKRPELFRFTSLIYGQGFISKLVFIGLLAAITSGAQFTLTWFLGVILDSVSQGLERVLRYFIILSAAVIINVLGNTLLVYSSGLMTSRFMLNLRIRLGAKLCKTEYEALEKIKDGDLLSITTNDIENFRPWLAALYSIGHLPVKILATTSALLFMNWKLYLSILPLTPIVVLPSLLLSNKLYALNAAERETAGKTTGFINNVLDFMLVVKSFCLESLFSIKNRNLLNTAERARLRRQLREQVIESFGRCLGHIINPLIFILGAYLILNGELTVGQIMATMLLTNITGEGLNLIYAIPTGYQAARASMERIGNILDLPDEEALGSPNVTAADTSVFTVKDLCFSYSETEVLKNLNFSIRQGEKIAIVGMSGSGKTTLFKLLSGLYRPASGSIMLRERNILSLSTGALRRELSVVTQESFLFPDTVRNNLLIARPEASDAEIITASRNARIYEFIKSRETGLDTKLTNIGTVLSKGQIQRIGLARAFLCHTPVWLLDEPTSALDSDTQTAIMDYILKETTDKTIVMIIHGLTMAGGFDKILVLDNGEVAGFDKRGVAQSCV
jgi:ABC-type multidrug transport system fused ATPase/permease subunit